MSGTSVDGVDAALVRLSGSGRATGVRLEAFFTTPFPSTLREQVLAVSHGEGNAESVSRLNVALGGLFSDAVESVLGVAAVTTGQVDLIASHGQTVSHTPPGTGAGATLQIGEAAVLAYRIGVPVVSDFRVADVAAGGQGAPLVPYADWCLLTHPTRARAVQNIGGIGNVTFLPADAAPGEVVGFDTGPGNMLIDRAAAWLTRDRSPENRLTHDRDGGFAARGQVDKALLEDLLRHPFLNTAPPKSAGREEFGESFWNEVLRNARGMQPCDLVATLTAFTAYSITDAYKRFLPRMPDEVVVGGGGTQNPTLMAMLRERLAPIPVLTHEDVGINSAAKEAIAFAVLGNETMLGNPSNLPSVTGASRPVVLGTLTLP